MTKVQVAATDFVAATEALARARRRFLSASSSAEPTAQLDPEIVSELLRPVIERVRANYSFALNNYKLACLVAKQAGVPLTPLEDALADLAKL